MIQQIEARVYLVEGSMKLSDINDELGTLLSSEDYDSIGGLIIENLDRLPEDGETITTAQNITLEVQGINQNRIVKVLMTLPEKIKETEQSDSTASSGKEEEAVKQESESDGE